MTAANTSPRGEAAHAAPRTPARGRPASGRVAESRGGDQPDGLSKLELAALRILDGHSGDWVSANGVADTVVLDALKALADRDLADVTGAKFLNYRITDAGTAALDRADQWRAR
jgi:hypothetical protein